METSTLLTHLQAFPDLKQVYYRMGFKPNRADIPATLRPRVKEAIFHGRELLEPKAIFTYRNIHFDSPDVIKVGNGFSIQSGKVYSWMAGVNGLYLTAVTIGPALDAEVARLSQNGEVTNAFLLNAYGAEAAEALMEDLDRELKRLAAAQHQETTKRYSPGYGDWPITAQRDLLRELPADRIGIQLTEKCLMIPEKSVSAIVGVKSMKVT